VYPSRSNVEFPGQLLKLRLALYGAKQSSALFFKLLNGFLLTLGFASSTLDPCFYRKDDAVLIVHVDDMRCAGTPEALVSIHEALRLRFNITTGDGTRFLGMDTSYDLASGVLTFRMHTYIQSIMDRFLNFDSTLGLPPYRELVGCLLWIVLCVVGPELVRVKDLARRSNNPTPTDYQDAFKVLKRIYKRRDVLIYFVRGSAGKEWIPSQTRPESSSTSVEAILPSYSDDDTLYPVLAESQRGLDIPAEVLPTTNSRFSQVGFTDASFAVGDLKLSVSGLIIYVNCTPVIWGSFKKTELQIQHALLNSWLQVSVLNNWRMSKICFTSWVLFVPNLIPSTPIPRLVNPLQPIPSRWRKSDMWRSDIISSVK
jgi:hypothetical protein